MSSGSDLLSVRNLAAALWSGRWIIVGFTVAMAAVATVSVLVLPKRYTAVAVVVPAQSAAQGGMGSLGALASRFGGLASLAGISLPSDSGEVEAIATLNSDGIALDFIRDNKMVEVLFNERWNADAGDWKSGAEPSIGKALDRFKKRVRSVEQDPKLGLIYVSATWTDPVLAAKWANGLVSATNSRLQRRAIEQSERNIGYLQEEVAKTSVVELRSSIYSLIETEIQRAVLARGNDEFALRVLDEAIVPEKPSSPKSAVWIPASILGGAFLSMLFVLVRESLRDVEL